jgi:predicted transcriptional regulator
MKSILISIRPEWCVKILNREKTVELRKTAPKCELPCEVFIYCTYGNFRLGELSATISFYRKFFTVPAADYFGGINGKVIAKFTLGRIYLMDATDELWIAEDELMMHKMSITKEQFKNYVGNKSTIYGWKISDLEIFDRLRDLSEFGVKRPPQSWQYINANKEES